MDAPNLPALIALEAVARLGNVTRAAASLHLTQSAVSHRLRNLQRELGVPLLERSGRGVRLTAPALELARATESALNQLQLAIVRAAPAARDRVLSISCSPSFAIRFLVPRLAAFRSAHPDYDLRIAAADVPVEPGHGADAAILLSSGPKPRLHCEKLLDEVVFPVASPRLLERGPPLRAAIDALQYTLLHDEALAGDPGRVDWAGWFAHAGVRGDALVQGARSVRFSHAYLALEAALAGDGIALARRSLVADDLQRGRLVAPFALEVPSGITYWFASALAPAERPAIALLRSFLKLQLTAAARRAQRVRRAGAAAAVSGAPVATTPAAIGNTEPRAFAAPTKRKSGRKSSATRNAPPAKRKSGATRDVRPVKHKSRRKSGAIRNASPAKRKSGRKSGATRNASPAKRKSRRKSGATRNARLAKRKSGPKSGATRNAHASRSNTGGRRTPDAR